MDKVIYSDKQGSGVVCSNSKEIYSLAQKKPIRINGTTYNPGDFTNLDNFFCRQLEYIGRNENEAFFLMGTNNDLFNEKWYYQSIYVISETRIFLMYAPNSGSDYNYVKTRWK